VRKVYLKKILGTCDSVLEIGANDGRDTIELAMVFPEATIHSVECDIRLFPLFLERTSAFPNIVFYPFAASDKDGFSTFYESYGASFGSSSLLPPNLISTENPDVRFGSQKTVVNGRISALLSTLGFEKLDLLWMDVQGAESMILRDLETFLPRIRAVYLEVEEIELYKGEALFPEIAEFLRNLGFVISDEFRSERKLENVLFLNSRFQ
jgi:FkbM family methyltransferase